jgi:hypothetical protein
MTNSLDTKSLQAIATGYKQLYQTLEVKQHHWIPNLALELARTLSHLSNDIWANR